MELFSIKPIAAGEEVMINYGQSFEHKTGVERNAYLRYVYGFTCKCKACADPVFGPRSDRRRTMPKHDFYCGMHGMAKAPDFSAKATGLDGPPSVRPFMQEIKVNGYRDGFNIFRPGTVEFMRRAVKLRYDEGFTGSEHLSSMNAYAGSALCNMHKRMVDRKSGLPVDPLPEVARCI